MAKKESKGGIIGLAKYLLFDSRAFGTVAALILAFDFVLNFLVIWKIPYTEIDWVAYMQEVAGPIERNDFDYTHLGGDTGPLVYPAGFVYIFSLLYWVTDHGKNIPLAQVIFAFLEVATLAVVFQIYKKCRSIPPWALILVAFSRRIHSIFVLRLFNDCIAMLLAYIAIWMFCNHRWTWGCAVFSFAVSVKMNVLLFFPALGVLLVKTFGFWRTLPRLFLIFVIQAVLAIPFLKVNAWGYLSRAFEFSRVFFHIWTVNLKFLPEHIFVDKRVAAGLLVGHLGCIVYLALFKWCKTEGGAFKVLFSTPSKSNPPKLNPHHIVSLMFVSNFVGIAFSRSLHFQFYVWYFHTIAFLLWSSPRLHTIVRIALWVVIEIVWNIFPSTPTSSLMLQAAHLILVAAVLTAPVPSPFAADGQQAKPKSQ